LIKEKKVLAVIPARGGSKGIPNKNIININNKPLINFSIETALKSKFIDDLVVSTDSIKIAKIAEKAGAKVPFLRPKKLATDKAISLPVILHALEFMEKSNNINYDIIIMLQPTTPLRETKDIDQCLSTLIDKNVDSVISVVNVGGYHPLRMKRIVGENLVNYIDQGFEDMRPRQELPDVYIRNGAIYVSTRKTILEDKSFSGKNTFPYVMSSEKSINLDTDDDLRLLKSRFNLNV
jgi:CMP-N,N'-diacetyllegionaminic acid synthase